MELEVGERTRQLLEALAAKLGTTVEQLMAVYEQQAWLEAVTFLWFSLLMSAVIFIIVAVATVYVARTDADKDAKALLWAAILLSILVIGAGGRVAYLKFQNPQYYAVRELMHDVRGGK